MNQLAFNLSEAIAAKNAGLRVVAENNAEFLEVARNIARSLCVARYEITADDVRRACPIEPAHPNAIGAIFRHKDFVFTGKYRKSALVSNHARDIKIWRLRNGS